MTDTPNADQYDRRHPPESVTLPEKDGVLVSRRMLLVAGAVVGFALSLSLVGVTLIALRINDIQEREIARNADNIADQQRTIDRLDDLTMRLADIETPNTRQLNRRIIRAIRACVKDPECRESLRELEERSGVDGIVEGSGASVPQGNPGNTSPAPSSTNPNTTRRGNNPRSGEGPGGNEPSPTPEPEQPPSTPQPLVDLPPVIPGLPPICVDGIVGVGCQR